MFSLDDIKDIVSRKRAPSHASEIALDAIEDTNINYDKLVVMNGVDTVYCHSFFRGESPITTEIANELGKTLGNGSESWIRLQEVYDLWHLFNNKQDRK